MKRPRNRAKLIFPIPPRASVLKPRNFGAPAGGVPFRVRASEGRFIFYLVSILCLILSSTACYEPVEGCLDIYASNYNANTDEVCEDDCCNYPQLQFSVSHRFGENNLSYDSVFFDNGSGDSIRIVQIIYYLSEIRLSGADGALTIADEISVNLDGGGMQTLTDDFLLVDFIKGQSYNIGEFRTAGTYDSLFLQIGLSQAAANTDPASLPSGHVLSVQADSMWQESTGYALGRVRLVTQANNSDTLSYFIPASGNAQAIQLALPLTVDFGETTSIAIQVDYQQWLAGIDFATNGTDQALIIAQIIGNLPNSISISQ